MKKIGIFILVIILIVSGMAYLYLNYVANNNIAKKENRQYETYYEQETPGSELATLINKAVDSNTNNYIQKDKKGKFIDNAENSINIDIKFIDSDKIYNMENIYSNGTENFMKFYNDAKFKCMKIEYHEKTNKVKYMYFEQTLEN